MESYKQSVKNVDAALARLNATLASYKIEAAKATQARSPSPAKTTSQSQPRKTSNISPGLAAASTALPPVNHPLLSQQPPPARGSLWDQALRMRSDTGINQVTHAQIPSCIQLINEIHALWSGEHDKYQYCIPVYILLAQTFLQIGYPDLAAGELYKALLLTDAVRDTSDEIHEPAFSSLREVVSRQPLVERISLLKSELTTGLATGHVDGEDEADIDVEVGAWLGKHYLLLIYRYLPRSLALCGCYKSASQYLTQGRRLYPRDMELDSLNRELHKLVAKHIGFDNYEDLCSDPEYSSPLNWPDKGFARREVYPWSTFEPDRLKDINELNRMMSAVAPKLEVRAVELLALTGNKDLDGKPAVSVQLGVFAKEDIAPGQVILNEKSLLTANNKMQDALCEACSADLPDLANGDNETVSCPECDVVFCSQDCYDDAYKSYHIASCETDAETICKDVPPAEAADALYTLLLLRTICMAETQSCNPLELQEVKYIWGDFSPTPATYKQWRLPNPSTPAAHLADIAAAHAGLPRTLPFSYEYNIRLPFHMLEKLDVELIASPQYNVWTWNTLYAKFRGTASARLSGLGGRAIRGPEVSAVHPMWCLANHSCDPNVSWEWGGSIKFWARQEGVKSHRPTWSGEVLQGKGGIKEGMEVLNHYCDIDLPVNERREWARGALGGDCQCDRCVWEAGEMHRYRPGEKDIFGNELKHEGAQ
ncbi:hypothetical protein EJ03DRAFT_199876 [Teratosphaeria nubilosa]|uniref:SET domain-containing protein n=1 Tax=Teratosphaeria nubilosa TaxID=161662 RepID=A0A6G1KYI7_9PEZI|nr:hypothetical protein EJ03DRAFT_199876 [Teratosphaeria nubilosa]